MMMLVNHHTNIYGRWSISCYVSFFVYHNYYVQCLPCFTLIREVFDQHQGFIMIPIPCRIGSNSLKYILPCTTLFLFSNYFGLNYLPQLRYSQPIPSKKGKKKNENRVQQVHDIYHHQGSIIKIDNKVFFSHFRNMVSGSSTTSPKWVKWR